MSFFANTDINRLAAHSALHQLGFGIGGAFVTAFLLRAGLPPARLAARGGGGAAPPTSVPCAASGPPPAVPVGAIVPPPRVAAPAVLRRAPPGAYRAAQIGVLLFACDGWIVVCSAVAWDMAA